MKLSRLHDPRSLRAGTTLIAAGTLVGCDSPQNYLHGAGPAARNLAALGWFVLVVFIVVSILTWLLILRVAIRRRGTLDWHAPIDTSDGRGWIVWGGVTVPTIVLAVVFGLSLLSLRGFPMAHAGHAGPQIRVIGQQWWFDAEYVDQDGVRSPTEIHIPVGQPVNLSLETRDVIHSFWIPKLHGKVDLVPGQTNYIRLQADKPGRYQGECGEYCGMQHANMRLTLVADAPDRYAQWLATQRAPARAAQSAEERHGAAVFQAAACPLCHAIRGTDAHGDVGPDLTHLASRGTIAGGSLTNSRANLQAWVVQAQAFKPGTRMPNLNTFSGADLQALVTYLQSLQ